MTRYAAVLIAIVSLLGGGVADAATGRHHRTMRHPEPQQQIACTVLGCAPVPRGCRPTEGRTWSGMPTGGDIVVCPPGVAPFR